MVKQREAQADVQELPEYVPLPDVAAMIGCDGAQLRKRLDESEPGRLVRQRKVGFGSKPRRQIHRDEISRLRDEFLREEVSATA